MVDRIPIAFRRAPPTIIQPFDSTEFATGRGIVEFDACNTSNANILTTEPAYSWEGAPNTGTNGNLRALNTNIDVDFDITFERTIIVEGPALLEFTAVMRRISGGPGALSTTITAILRHYDGTTETALGTGTFVLAGTIDDGETVTHLGSFDFDISKRRFNVGDILRLTLQATNNSTTWDVWIFTDPLNRTIGVGDYTGVSARCRLLLPIKN